MSRHRETSVHYRTPKVKDVSALRAQSLQRCLTLWPGACQAPPSMGFSRQEYWSGLPCPSPGDLPDPGIEPRSPTLQADALTAAPLNWTELNWIASDPLWVCRSRHSLSWHVLLLLNSFWLPEVSSHNREVERQGLVQASISNVCHVHAKDVRGCLRFATKDAVIFSVASKPSEVWFRFSNPMSVCVYGKYWKSEPNVSRQKQCLEKLNHRQSVVEKALAEQHGQSSQ